MWATQNSLWLLYAEHGGLRQAAPGYAENGLGACQGWPAAGRGGNAVNRPCGAAAAATLNVGRQYQAHALSNHVDKRRPALQHYAEESSGRTVAEEENARGKCGVHVSI
jgi:hypothetical protein